MIFPQGGSTMNTSYNNNKNNSQAQLEQGTTYPKVVNFYLTPDSLVIYYQPYVYTPGYYGVLEFKIPDTQIMDIVTPRGRSDRFYRQLDTYFRVVISKIMVYIYNP
jgi:hypothetical protein